MSEFFWRLFDTDDFTPRRACGNWSEGHAWLHIGSDLFIWAAYVSIPLILLWFLRRWPAGPVRYLGLLFVTFILSCGCTHFLDALMFYYPAYRLAGLAKFLTAVVSWATVIALVPLAPRVLDSLDSVAPMPRELPADPEPAQWNYGVAVLGAALAMLLRGLFDPLLATQHAFIFAILAVLFVGWLTDLGPALATLVLTFIGTAYFFAEPRGSLIVAGLSNQVGFVLFFFGGVVCAVVASSERRARLQLSLALYESIERRVAVEREMGLRRAAETERAVAQKESAHALAHYQTLAEAMPQLVWEADASGKVTYFNQRWLEYTGYRVGDLDQADAARLIHPEDAENLNTSWRKAVDTRADQFTCEFRLRHRDGLYFWHISNARPIRSPEGTVLGWVGALTNIHDQKARTEWLEREVSKRTQDLQQQVEERTRAEAKVKASAAELQRSNQELESFASVASHDLQEPLRKILAFGDRLARGSRESLGETGRDQLDRIQNAAGRMRRLIEDLLTYARVTTRARPFCLVDLARVTREVLSDLEARTAQSHARIEVGDLPTLQADPSQMRQLLQNLISNALKFTAPGTTPHVRIATEPAPPGMVHLIVEDHGIGFETRYLDRIFQVFQRLHGRTEYEGTGIGLAICKKIVERHGGCITARSQPGAGATFVVTLPLEQPTREDLES